MSQCRPEDDSVWGPRFAVNMGGSVCRTCFNTCLPNTAPQKCFSVQGSLGVPRWQSTGETYWNPLTSFSRSEWDTDWVATQKANEAASQATPLKFASFNIQVFGVSKYGKTIVKDQIIEILRRYDISTIQVEYI